MAFQRAITVNHSYVFGSLTNFPVMFNGSSYSWLRTLAHGGSVANSSGHDIYFTSDIGGVNLLPFERVAWDPSTGACEFWVLILSLPSTADTTFYIHYGDATQVTDLQDRAAVWDSNYVGVWHFGDGATLDLTDSTANHNDGTNIGGATATTSLLAGGGGGAVNLSGSQYISIPATSSLDLTGPLTIECGGYGYANNLGIVGKGSPNSSGFDVRTNGSGDLGFSAPGGTPHSIYLSGVGLNAWFVFFTYNGSNAIYYYDKLTGNNFSAGSSGSWGAGAIGANSSIPLSLGAFTDGSGKYTGPLDEVRISKVVRSSAWLQTHAWQITDTLFPAFFTVGPETIGSALCPISQRGNIDYDQIAIDARHGNGPRVQMWKGDPSTMGHVAVFDECGNVTDGGGVPVLGVGDISQADVTSSRAFGTVYHNAGIRPMFVAVTASRSANGTIEAYSDGNSPPTTAICAQSGESGESTSLFFVVLAGNYYEVTNSASASVGIWIEWS